MSETENKKITEDEYLQLLVESLGDRVKKCANPNCYQSVHKRRSYCSVECIREVERVRVEKHRAERLARRLLNETNAYRHIGIIKTHNRGEENANKAA